MACVFSYEEVTASWTIAKETESDPFFTCTLKEGTVLSLTKSSDNAASISLSTPDGLHVQLLPNGKVNQRIVHQSESTKKLNEISRVIGSDVGRSTYHKI